MANERRAGGLKIDLGLNLANLAKDVGKATSQLSKLEKNISSIGSNLSRGFQAALAVAGVFAVKKLSDALVDLADKGDRASDIAENFRVMGGSSSSIEEARTRILGVVDSFELMRIANTGLLRDVPGINQNFGLMAEYGAKLADTLGTEAAPAIQQVVEAFASGKQKQLEAIGVTINAEKAYADYAKEIGQASDKLDDAQQKEARQLAGLKELQKVNEKRGELTESVTQANQRLNAAMTEGLTKIGQAINDSPQLTKAYNDIAKALEGIDWERLGSQAAGFFATVSSLAAMTLERVNNLSRGLDYLFGNSIQAQADRSATKIEDLRGQIEELETSWKPGALLDQANGGRVASELRGQLVAEQNTFKNFEKQIEENKKKTGDLASANNELKITFNGLIPPIKNTGASIGALKDKQKEAAKEAEELAKAQEKFNEKLNELTGQTKLSSFSKELESIADQYARNVITGTEAARQVRDLSQATRDSAPNIEKFSDEVEDAFKNAKDLIDKIEDAKQGGGLFGSIFDDAFSGISKNDPDLIKKGRNLGEQLSGSLAQGLQEGIQLSLDGANGEEFRASLSKSIFSGLSIAAESKLPGSGQFVQALEPLFAKGLEKIFGGENAGTTARKSADKFFADAFDANRLAVIINGQLVQIKDLVFKGQTLFGGNSDFNSGSFDDFLGSLPQKVQQSFKGVGAAFEELLGVSEDISGQIAAALANNIGGSLNNLQLLVMRSGKSFEELNEGIVTAFENQRLTAAEAQSALAGIAQVSEKGIPGLDGIEALTQAWSNFVAAGPKGGIALTDAIQDIGHEAQKMGLDLAGAQQQLIATGKFDAEAVNQAFQALRDSGITSIQQLTSATTQQLLPALANLEINKFPFAEAEAKLEDISKKLEGIDDHLEKELTIKVTTEFDKNTEEALKKGAFDDTQLEQIGPSTEQFAKGAILRKATFIRPNALAGEAGPEGILPLGNINGKLGVHFKGGGSGRLGNVSIVVNAPGGDGQDILNALYNAEEQIVNRTVNIILDAADRGTFGGM